MRTLLNIILIFFICNCSNIAKEVPLNTINGYFTSLEPEEINTLIVEKAEFLKYFHPASTMRQMPTKIDFDREKVGAIVLPETPYDTQIILLNSSIENEILHIKYEVKISNERRTFTIIPLKLFSFSKNLSYKSIIFDKE